MDEIRDCEHCVHYKEYKDGLHACEKWECEYERREGEAGGASMSANDRQVTGKLNSEIENSKSEIVPDYRDGWRLKEGDPE